jgi:hypothetical protein
MWLQMLSVSARNVLVELRPKNVKHFGAKTPSFFKKDAISGF